jgi:hypothetical protein
MAILVAALLGLSALVVVVAPLFLPAPQVSDATATAAPSLVERERAARVALHDVEFDYELGNLGEDDYHSLRARYTRRALSALKGRHDSERTLDAAIEERVRALRAGDGHAGQNGSATPPGRS